MTSHFPNPEKIVADIKKTIAEVQHTLHTNAEIDPFVSGLGGPVVAVLLGTKTGQHIESGAAKVTRFMHRAPRDGQLFGPVIGGLMNQKNQADIAEYVQELMADSKQMIGHVCDSIGDIFNTTKPATPVKPKAQAGKSEPQH